MFLVEPLQVVKGTGGQVISAAAGGIVSAAGAVQLLSALGFWAAGVKAGSVAAVLQSSIFGAVVPAGSWFALATSWGATGAIGTPVAVVTGPVGAVAAGAAWFYFRR